MSGGLIAAILAFLTALGLGLAAWVRGLISDARVKGRNEATGEAAAEWIKRENELRRETAKAEKAAADRATKHAADLAALEAKTSPEDVRKALEGAGLESRDPRLGSKE